MCSSPYRPLGPAHRMHWEQESEGEKHARKRIGVFFATRTGHTRKIAEHIVYGLRERGFDVDLQDIRRPLAFDLSHYRAAVLAASVHLGNHEKEMIRFVRTHRSELNNLLTAFISVTLSEAGLERLDATPLQHTQFAADVDRMMNKFYQQTQWHPTHAKAVAGALLYTKYNVLLRFVMKRIARKAGAATDTSRDFDYTDWAGLDKFVEELTAEMNLSPVPAGPSGESPQTAAKAWAAGHT